MAVWCPLQRAGRFAGVFLAAAFFAGAFLGTFFAGGGGAG